MKSKPKIQVLNGIAAGNPHVSFRPRKFAFGIFDTAPAFILIGGSFAGFSRADELRGPHKPHQWHWTDIRRPGWAQDWAAAQDMRGWFDLTSTTAGSASGEMILYWDSEPLYHDAHTVGRSDFYHDLEELSQAGRVYNELAPEGLTKIGAYIVDRARAKWPERTVRVAFSNLVRQPGYGESGPNVPSEQALLVARRLSSDGFALALKLRFGRSDKPKSMEEAEAWATIAISARRHFGDVYTFAESYWEGERGGLPLVHQLAGAMRACAKAGIPLVITGDSYTIENMVGLAAFSTNIIAARSMAAATPIE